MSQCQRLLEALQQGPVTPLMALNTLGIYRLAARVKELREDGHKISTSNVTVYNRWGEPCRVAEYVLHA